MKKIIILILIAYKKTISKILPPACRFYPTCSEYTLEAVKKHGAFKGIFLGVRRILKCNPFHPGGVDLVPDEFHFFKNKF